MEGKVFSRSRSTFSQPWVVIEYPICNLKKSEYLLSSYSVFESIHAHKHVTKKVIKQEYKKCLHFKTSKYSTLKN